MNRDELDALLAQLDAVRSKCYALRALLAEAVPELRGELWQESRICGVCYQYDGHRDGCLVARIDAALRSE